MISLQTFSFEGKPQPVTFVETMSVTDGVECDVYTFIGDKTKDLGIIRVQPGAKTPLQKVLQGDRTIEGYLSGKGRLVITKPDNSQKAYEVDEATEKPFEIVVAIGEIMQWQADTELVAYEICFPPYQDGRYENLPE